MLSIVLATAGIAVLGACAVKVLVALRGLGRELERAQMRLAPGQEALRREVERAGANAAARTAAKTPTKTPTKAAAGVAGNGASGGGVTGNGSGGAGHR
jgi:hypothetical protein